MRFLTQGATTLLALSLILGSVTACSHLSSFKQPTIQVTAIRLLPGNSLFPALALVLLVSNPNAHPLPLNSFSYELSLNNHRVLSGVANQLPTLAAHGEAEVTLNARPDVAGAGELLYQLMQRPHGQLNYQLKGELDPGLLLPTLRLERAGKLPLGL